MRKGIDDRSSEFKKEDDFDKKVDRLYRQFSKSSTFKKHAEKWWFVMMKS